MPLSKPQDPRWHGPQSKYPTINLLKTTFLIPFTILIIVETTLHRIWYNAYYSTVEYDSSETIAYFFLRLGLSLIPDFLSAISTPSTR
ncbi:uncharacterized protein EKO05_0011154 [Ascochyta rabiei]|uniref:uncharacterized protein n=1 Tax=Didymella rabiei TaxID=5454 RepID=UPI002204596F|nr:uncharacterized protein EKO05_0011154 [Ascochyta rabiei]UPX20944.1 hypothetical protein EKO05_0011154 [Ascochyta rabiei]